VATIGVPTAACAADSPDAVSADLSEVVVTARRVEERLQDVPMSITVLSQRDLTDYNISSAGDLAAYVPALSVSNQFGSDASSFVIRGFSQDIGTSPTVGTYFGDVVAPRGGFGGATIHAGEGAGPGSLFDLENVEVLKGPQGTLFGRNTTGGAILLVPQKPTSKFEGYLEASGGDYDMERVQGAINIPISDGLRIRAGFDQQTRNGYITNLSDIGPKTFNDVSYIAGRLSVVANPTPNLENYTIASYTNSNNNGTDTQIVACNAALALGGFACGQLAQEGARRGPYTVDNSVPNATSHIRQWQVINTTTWNSSDAVTFKNIASVSGIRVINDGGLFGDNFQLPTPFGSLPFRFTAEDTPPDTPLSSQGSISEEPRLTGRALDGKLDWQAGLYYEYSYPIGTSGSSGPNQIACSDFQNLRCLDVLGTPGNLVGNVGRRYGKISYRDYGVYAQDTFAITTNWKLTTGIRYSYDVTSANTFRYAFYFPTSNFPPATGTPLRRCESGVTTADCQISDRQKSDAPTGLVNLQYSFNEDLLSYAQYARGYRQGGILSTGPIDNETYQPEHLNAYEIGLKATIKGPVSGFVNAAVFYNDFTSQQIQGTFVSTVDPSVPVNAGILNAGKSRIYGFDLDSSLMLTSFLRLATAYTYLDSKLVKITPQQPNGIYNVFGPNEPQGSELTFSPHHKLSITPTVLLPVDRQLGKMSVGVNYLYTGRQLVFDTGPYAYLPTTHLLNLNANWESVYSLPLDLEFFMTNVTNLHYPNYVDNFLELFGFTAQSFGPPRMYGGRVRYHF
ncbi:MAG TPA: TonB-dependent receptor, partial [Steroidobacteraceae bacterium]|nr:TonB-dependent receptor [Steroidobacteraceae bacterium]